MISLEENGKINIDKAIESLNKKNRLTEDGKFRKLRKKRVLKKDIFIQPSLPESIPDSIADLTDEELLIRNTLEREKEIRLSIESNTKKLIKKNEDIEQTLDKTEEWKRKTFIQGLRYKQKSEKLWGLWQFKEQIEFDKKCLFILFQENFNYLFDVVSKLKNIKDIVSIQNILENGIKESFVKLNFDLCHIELMEERKRVFMKKHVFPFIKDFKKASVSDVDNLDLDEVETFKIHHQSHLELHSLLVEQGFLVKKSICFSESFSLARNIRDSFSLLPNKIKYKLLNLNSKSKIKKIIEDLIIQILSNFDMDENSVDIKYEDFNFVDSPNSTSCLLVGAIQGAKVDPKINIVEWSNKYRILATEGAKLSGKYDMNYFPFLIEIAEHLSPQSPVQYVFVCKGVQLGFTELGNNMLFTYADLYPCPMLMVFPVKTLLKQHLDNKFWSGINVTPRLKEKIKPVKQGATNSSSSTFIKFGGGSIVASWSESKSTFASGSYRVCHLSDIDRFPDDVGGEGDTVALASKRLSSFGEDRKLFGESSPTKKGVSKIYYEAKNGDQNRYFMNCPECKGRVTFLKDSFTYDFDELTYELTSDVSFVCEHCGSLIPEYQKHEMMRVENGAKWQPMNPDFRNPLRKTYFIGAYYSPIYTWNEIFQELLDAEKDKELYGKTNKLKVWYNTIDGTLFDDEAEKEIETTVDQLLKRREEYQKIPDNVVLLSAGIDTQGDRFEVSVYGWVNDREKYLIAHYIIVGDPKDIATQKQLDKLLFSKFFECEDGGEMKIFCSAIDTGGNKTEHVYNYVLKRYKKYRLFAVKGGKSVDDPLVKDYSMVKTKRNKPLKLYVLGVNSAKDDWISDIEEQFNSRYLHFSFNIQSFFDGVTMDRDMSDRAFLQQFLEETKDENGRWKNELRRRNEALDCAIYANASVKCVKGLDLDMLSKLGKRAFYRK
jgi:phage terminase large subunit GpA-like protein